MADRNSPGSLARWVELAASNYARSTASSYWLIKGYDEHQQVYWVTLRVATHRLWLQNAHQIEVLWEEPGTFGDLFNAVSDSLHPIAVQEAKFRLSPLDIAVLNLLITLEHHKLIWFIRMIPDIARAHKDKLFDLTTDFWIVSCCLVIAIMPITYCCQLTYRHFKKIGDVLW